MMDLANKPRSRVSEHILAAFQYLALSSFGIDLDQVRRRVALPNEIVERNRFRCRQGTIRQNRHDTARLDSALSPSSFASPERNAGGGRGPCRRFDNLDPVFESVLDRCFPAAD